MRSLVTAHTTSLYVMPEVSPLTTCGDRLNRASSVFLDSPVKRLCRNCLKCEFVILNPSNASPTNEGLGFGSGKLREESHEINDRQILRLGPQNDNCDTVSKPGNDKNVVLLMNSLVSS